MGKSTVKSPHPRSRKAEQFHSQVVHDKKMTHKKSVKTNKMKMQIKRFQWFFENLDTTKTSYTQDDVKSLIKKYLAVEKEKFDKEVLKKGRNVSSSLELKKDIEEKLFTDGQFELPDLTDEHTLKCFQLWNEESNIFNMLKMKNF
jgi:hypothetical protein